METNNIELIEAFLNGTVTADQQTQVETRLHLDEEFKQDYEMYQLMVTAITETRKSELKTFISKNVKVKPAPFFRTPTFYAAAAASVVLCLISYFVIFKKLKEQNLVAQNNTENTNSETKNTPNSDTIKMVDDHTTSQNTAVKEVAEPPVTNTTEPADINPKINDKEQLQNRTSKKDDGVKVDDVAASPDDVSVESDKMQLDTFLFISRKIYIAKPKQYQTNPSDLYAVITTGDKLKLEVQFWKSPINYSGYKFHKNLLVVYGNFDPANASYQELKDVVYMKYKNDYYKMTPTQVYTTLKKETDSKIIADLEFKK